MFANYLTSSKIWYFIFALILIIIIFLLYDPFFNTMLNEPRDLSKHLQFAKVIWKTHHIYPSHFLFHILVILIHTTFPEVSFEQAAKIILLFSKFSLGIILYVLFFKSLLFKRSTVSVALISFILTLCLIFAAPLYSILPALQLIGLFKEQTYIGFIPLTDNSNPTYTLLHPLALLLFITAVKFLQERHYSYKMLITLNILAVITTLAKPNFTICLLPSIALVLLCRLISNKKANWLALSSLIASSSLVLAGQFYLTFLPGIIHHSPEHLRIVWAPLAVTYTFLKNCPIIELFLLKILPSILFPLLVICMFFPQALQNFPLRFAWLNFLVAFLYYYCFWISKNNGLINQSDFVWGTYITLFILFLTSLLFLIRQIQLANTPFSLKNPMALDQKSGWESIIYNM